MFKIEGKDDLNQISLTGMRAIVFMGLLIKSPKSLDEIRNIFTELKIMGNNNSDDILRIDLNTIKHMGCEIDRCSAKTGHKYVLTKHPFDLKVAEDEIKIIKKVYKKIKQNGDIETLIKYHRLFEKISDHICDEKIKNTFLGISPLRFYDIDEITDFLEDCKNKRYVCLIYKKPTSKYETRKDVIAQNIIFENDKLHLHCYDIQNERSIVLNIKRILSVLSRKNYKSSITTKTTKIKFFIENANLLDKNEIVIETIPDGFIVEGEYYNDFIATQRILSFGSKCTIIEPIEFRNKVVNKIKEMRKRYES